MQGFFERGAAVVDDVRGEHKAVGDGDVDVFNGAEMSGEEGFFDHVAEGVVDLDAVADFEGAGVSEHDAGDDIRDGGRRAEREQYAEERWRRRLKAREFEPGR